MHRERGALTHSTVDTHSASVSVLYDSLNTNCLLRNLVLLVTYVMAGCMETVLVKEGEGERLTCVTCDKRHSVDPSGLLRPWFPNLSISQLVTSLLSATKHLCPTHKHECNYYCFQDKALVCIYCAYHGDHAGHVCHTVSEARRMAREGLRPVKMRAQGRAAELDRRLQLLRDEGEGVRAHAENSVKMVEEYFASLEAALQRQRDLLLQDLHSHTTHLRTSLDTQIKYVLYIVLDVSMCYNVGSWRAATARPRSHWRAMRNGTHSQPKRHSPDSQTSLTHSNPSPLPLLLSISADLESEFRWSCPPHSAPWDLWVM